MKKKRILLTAAAVAVIAVIAARFMDREEAVSYERRPTVTAENPQVGDICLYTDLTGLVEPESKASVMPKIGGEVLEVYFQAGDAVVAGQPLLKIDSDALTTLKLQMDAAAVSMQDAANSAQRTRALYADGFVSQEAMEQAENGLQSATIAYESAKTQYELQVEYTTVTAPITGVIETRNVDPHDHVSTSTEVCTISGEDSLQIKFGVTEKIFRNLAVGDTVRIEKNGTEYEGRISEIGSMVNAGTGLYDVRAVAAESAGLSNGARVKLTVLLDRAERAMVIPVDAVNYDNGDAFVYCYEDGRAVKTMIGAGLYDDKQMEVTEGLTPESLVITSWSNEMYDQSEVILKTEEMETEEQAGTDPQGETGETVKAQAKAEAEGQVEAE